MTRRGPRPVVVSAFGDFCADTLGTRYGDDVLAAALGAVSIQPKQASEKLSPIIMRPRPNGGRPSPTPTAPYVASTYSSFASCPGSCPFLTDRVTGERHGCLVDENVNMRRTMQRLDKSAAPLAGRRDRHMLLALAEAFMLDKVFAHGVPQDGARGGRDLRLHVAGDAPHAEAAAVLAAAAAQYRRNGGGRVWSFTHGWPTTPRDAWGDVSVLASVETLSGLEAARRRGYATAIVLDVFPSNRAFPLEGAPGVRVVPCPAELDRKSASTGQAVTCASCGLCLNDQGLIERNTVIAFRAHSTGARATKTSIAHVRAVDTQVRRFLPIIADHEASNATGAEIES